MKVLLVGATGNLGLTLIPALLSHNHSIIAFVRSPSKLTSLLPTATLENLTIIQGNATDSSAIKAAILQNDCDAVINTAGVAALAPWAKSDLPEIFRAVVDGVVGAAGEREQQQQQNGSGRSRKIRLWVLGGQGVLKYPGTDVMLSRYLPIFLAHRQNYAYLNSLPQDSQVSWSMLCPSTMTPPSPSSSSSNSPPSASAQPALLAKASHPPAWHLHSWLSSIPLLGKFLVVGMNAPRYVTTLEQNAEFIARDLAEYAEGNGESEWVGKAVGVIDPRK